MKLRFLLYQIGAAPDAVEIDEALELCEMYSEHRASLCCPLMENS